ncbi:hypothetical protein [Ectobacillus ponti]|uniref:Uncharacterized protein n=1 Tax=Ectobacillus ponti TaxID=2961894 RepID=A0AA41X7R4_9BACI|nr:hypothetical protein [Ectobacillus ponti]MCP8968435.1 hypothetical protein [Ectobacillus ponti]
MLNEVVSSGGFLFMVLLFYSVAVPVSVLLHEVGHGIPKRKDVLGWAGSAFTFAGRIWVVV